LIVKGIKFSLEQDGMEVDAAYDGEEALRLVRSVTYSLVILDVMLPKIDGLQVCQQIREFSTVPVIMVTAKGEDMDKIMGLEYGADDYLTKPFNILELKARIKAILRRSSKNKDNSPGKGKRLYIRGLEVNLESKRVFVEGKEANLTAKEYDLLQLLMEHPGKVYSREELLNTVWGANFPGDARTVDVHVRRLREKIEKNPSDPSYINTKWGVGYYFN
jgi:DNA-binding response OmpR family regulator